MEPPLNPANRTPASASPRPVIDRKDPILAYTCCIPGCPSKKGRKGKAQFHRFPQRKKYLLVSLVVSPGCVKTIDSRRAWIWALKMKSEPRMCMKVCSLHFRDNDYFYPGNPKIKPRLNRLAVPSQNLPTIPWSRENLPVEINISDTIDKELVAIDALLNLIIVRINVPIKTEKETDPLDLSV